MKNLLGHMKEEDLKDDDEVMGRALDEKMQDPAMYDEALPDPNGPSFDDIFAELTGGKKLRLAKKRASEEQGRPKKLPPMR